MKEGEKPTSGPGQEYPPPDSAPRFRRLAFPVERHMIAFESGPPKDIVMLDCERHPLTLDNKGYGPQKEAPKVEDTARPLSEIIAERAGVKPARVPTVTAKPSDYTLEKGAQHNPTLICQDGRLTAIIRVLNGAQTTNYLVQLDEKYQVCSPRRITLDRALQSNLRNASYELEDLRLFTWKKRLWAIAAIHHGARNIRQALIELNPVGNIVTGVHTFVSDRFEKNWMPCVSPEGDLRLIYSIEPLVVMDVTQQLDGFQVFPSPLGSPPILSRTRGGSQLVRFEDGWLSIVHQVYRRPVVPPNFNPLLSGFWPPPNVDAVAGNETTVYVHRFARFDEKLTEVHLSAPFYFNKPGIEFCAGLCTRERDGETELIASYGVADKEAWLAVIEPRVMKKLFLRGSV